MRIQQTSYFRSPNGRANTTLVLPTVTQDVEDFMGSRMGRAVVANASMQFLLKQSSTAVDVLSDVFKLTEEEKKRFKPVSGGAGTFLCGTEPCAPSGGRQPDRNQSDYYQPRPSPTGTATRRTTWGQGTIDLNTQQPPGV
jgi:hypothetical protein